MLFNSTTFLVFLAGVLAAYWVARNHLSARNLLILAGSYVFYGAWDVRFLALIFGTSVLDYSVGRIIDGARDERIRKGAVALSLGVNLAALGFFKYYNFFAGSLRELAANFGFSLGDVTLDIVLPVGISFYTFQSASYVVDVYRRQVGAERNPIVYLSYVAFFPQLVAGPIERASHLLPQFRRTLTITTEMLLDGGWLIIRGLFKKVVLADNLDSLVGLIFNSQTTLSGWLTVIGAIAFGAQVYCDFSGYSDVARGCAKWLGFELMVNFERPYFARSLAEFWRRWHISLSTWIRDYVYIPLGGSRCGPMRNAANVMLTMMLAGLWHGAAITFVLWGILHGGGLLIGRAIRGITALERLWMWVVVLLGWILFRARSVEEVYTLLAGVANWSAPIWLLDATVYLLAFAGPMVLLDAVEARGSEKWARRLLVAPCLLAVVFYWERKAAPFIYFQF